MKDILNQETKKMKHKQLEVLFWEKFLVGKIELRKKIETKPPLKRNYHLGAFKTLKAANAFRKELNALVKKYWMA